MKTTVITNAIITTSKAEIRNHSLIINNNKIAGILEDGRGSIPEDSVIINAKGYRLMPGLIDTHVSGAMGVDCRQGAEAVEIIGKALAQKGITSWLPTLYAVVPENLSKSISQISKTANKPNNGSQVLGIHLEGPYFTPARRGIARPEDVSKPNAKANQSLLQEYGDIISLVTLSPELDGVIPLIKQFVESGVVVAAGHTTASKEDLVRARDAGLSHVTHIFNAMDDRGWIQPGVIKPGTSDFCLLENRFTASVICDGVHVLPELLRLVIKVKGLDKTIAITDLWPGAGLEQGTKITYVTGEETIVAADAMRMQSDNQLAGTTTFLNKCAKNLMEMASLSWTEVVQMCCVNSAKMLKIDDKKGDLVPGMDADIIAVNDNWEPQLVMIEGNIVKNNLRVE